MPNRIMNALFAVRSVVILAILNVAQLSAHLLWQYQGPGALPSTDWMSAAEHLTLSGALILAVFVLWKQIGKKDTDIARKDDLLIESAKTVTAALSAAAASNIELRGIIKESVDAKRELAASIEGLRTSLQKLPCVDPSTWESRHHGQGRE
jgi:hypothetical protein